MINRQVIDELCTFVGCGRIDAPIVFIGMEPGANEKCLSLEQNIEVRRAHFGTVIELRKAHQLLNEEGQKLSQVWLFITKIVRLMTQEPDWKELASVKSYVYTQLGSAGGSTLLAELLPLPRPNMAVWPYESMYENFEKYKSDILEQRLDLFRNHILKYKPRFVFIHGKGDHEDVKRLFSKDTITEWKEVESSVFVAATVDTVVIFLPFLGNGQMSHKKIETLVQYLRLNFPERFPLDLGAFPR